jgi:hypothetical protein
MNPVQKEPLLVLGVIRVKIVRLVVIGDMNIFFGEGSGDRNVESHGSFVNIRSVHQVLEAPIRIN